VIAPNVSLLVLTEWARFLVERWKESAMASSQRTGGVAGPLSSRSRVRPAARVIWLLLMASGGLLAQDGNWSYHQATDLLTDMRSDAVWTDAAVPASPGYQLGVTCDDTEYVSVLVRSDSVIMSAARLSVRFDGGAAEVLPVQYSVATSKRFDFEPGGPALRRILASRKMAFSLQDKDLQEISLQFDIAGLDAAIKQMPLKCQDRLAELVKSDQPEPKPAGRSHKRS